jgi:DNA repair protein RecN (Recombination protein N)
MLADIHTQEETLRLINPTTYLEIIDGFTSDEIEESLNKYEFYLEKYKAELREFKRLENSNNDLLERLDLMRFQQKEIESFHLEPEEEETLEAEVDKMNNFDKIYQTLNESKQMIDTNEAVDVFYDVAKNLSGIKEINDVYETLQSRLESSYYELLDIYEMLSDEINALDFDPKLLDAHQTRLNQLDNLKRKYRKNIPEIIEYYDQIKKDINNIDNFDEVLKTQRTIVQSAFKKTLEIAQDITKIRKKTAKYIEKEIIDILGDLELSKTSFEIVFKSYKGKDYLDHTIFTERGIDEVEFMISTNVGEPTKPLSKTASGGEMSRIMLGFKNLLAKSLGLSLMIFDEIDSGVSGFVANQVAKKMKQIATTTQVICITHIPQVAALSDHHMHISKTVSNDRTKATIKLLNREGRIEEIAQMISGDVISNAALESAKNLLK